MKYLLRLAVILMIVSKSGSVLMAGEINQIKGEEPLLITSVIDRTITYQGILRNGSGTTVPNSTYNLIFRIYKQSLGGTTLWTSSSIPVTTSGGLFSTQLGPISLPFDTTYYLSLQVGVDPEMTQRQMMTMSPYSAVSDTANNVPDNSITSAKIINGTIQFGDIGQNGAVNGQIMKWNGSAWVACNDSAGGIAYWIASDSVLYTNGYWGIARGNSGNQISTDSAHTIVNLGVACTTGVLSFNDRYNVIGGGLGNAISHLGSVVSGGMNNRNHGDYSYLGGGYSNWISANVGSSAISGGENNTINGHASFLGGGLRNAITPNGSWSVLGGGVEDSCKGPYSFIGGGHLNVVSAANTTVSGGYGNIAEGVGAAIGGGEGNRASNYVATISGGDNNLASSMYSTIGGGFSNAANGAGSYMTIGGGEANTASGDRSTIGGGSTNTASAGNTTVSGGSDNIASNSGAATGGGSHNRATGSYTAISGGFSNVSSGIYAAIGGGFNNLASGNFVTIPGGYYDSAMALYGGVASGYSNLAGNAPEDTGAFVGGGYDNSATNKYAAVNGGNRNAASGSYAEVGGGLADTARGNYAVVGGGSQNTASGVNAAIGGGAQNIASNSISTISGGSLNTASGGASFIGGGQNNTSSGNFSSVGGGYYNNAGGLYSSIPGGRNDTIGASSDYSMAFGYGIYCNDDYRVTFFDGANFGSLNINRDGRDGYNTYPIQVGTSASNGNGAYLSNSGVWTNASSRTFKENFTPFNGQELLRKISALSVTTYNYKNSTEKHIGPVAEEFVGAFDTGVIRESDGKRDDQYLAASDVAGVALAGVQELLKKIEALEKEVAALKAQQGQR